MATPLPFAEWIKNPVTWTGGRAVTEFRAAGAGMLSVSHGLKSIYYNATLEYVLDAPDALSVLRALEAVDYNKVYQFTCNTAGLTRVFVTGAATYTENHPDQKVRVWLPVERRV